MDYNILLEQGFVLKKISATNKTRFCQQPKRTRFVIHFKTNRKQIHISHTQ